MPKNPFKVLNPEELAVYEWQFKMSGSFKTALMEAIARADQDNLAKLASVFPNEVFGFVSFSRFDGWWEKVLKKVDQNA